MILTECGVNGLIHQACSDLFQLSSHFITDTREMGREVIIGQTNAGYDLKGCAQRRGKAPGKPQGRRRVFRAVDTDNDAFRGFHGNTVDPVSVRV